MAVGLLGYSNRFAIYIIATRLPKDQGFSEEAGLKSSRHAGSLCIKVRTACQTGSGFDVAFEFAAGCGFGFDFEFVRASSPIVLGEPPEFLRRVRAGRLHRRARTEVKNRVGAKPDLNPQIHSQGA